MYEDIMCKIKNLVLAITIMALLPVFIQQGNNIFAQDISGNLSLYLTLQQMQSSTLADLYLPQYGNSADINQFGNTNTAYINQVSTNTISNGNIGVIYQYMQNNSANISQTGSNNKSYIGQAGIGNQASTTIEGNDNKTGILQIGDNNTASQDISGDSNGYLILQMGSNNTFSQIGQNETVSGYKIYQTGNGMNLKILNGRY